jgi:hypothetical protein
VEALHERDPGRGDGVAHLPGLLGVARRRLLGEHVLARPHRGEVSGRLQHVGHRVLDDLDLRVGDERGVGVDDALDAVACREGLGPGPVAGGDGDEPVPSSSLARPAKAR